MPSRSMNGQEAIEFIESRRSIRSYRPDMVPDDIIDRIVEPSRTGPCAKGSRR